MWFDFWYCEGLFVIEKLLITRLIPESRSRRQVGQVSAWMFFINRSVTLGVGDVFSFEVVNPIIFIS